MFGKKGLLAKLGLMLGVFLIAVAQLQASEKNGTTVTVAGGELDLGLADIADVYVGTPKEAVAGPSCRVAEEYVRLIQAEKYDKVSSLFREDAVLLEPMRHKPAIGRAAIDRFYREIIAPMRPRIVPVSYVGEGSECVLGQAAQYPVDGEKRYVMISVNHFTVDDKSGKVVRMTVFARPVNLDMAVLKN